MDMNETTKRYGNAILKYCFGILCDYHEAQDAMQETFAKAYFAGKSLKSDENLRAWLYKIAYRVCLNIARKRRPVFFCEGGVFDAGYEMKETFIDPVLTDALMILSPKDRALFYSRAVDDMDYAQLETLYGVRADALRKRFERAKTKLKNHLMQTGYTSEGAMT